MPTDDHRSLPKIIHCFNKPEPSCQIGRRTLRQPDRMSRMPTLEFRDGQGTSQAIRMLGHASVSNTLATSYKYSVSFYMTALHPNPPLFAQSSRGVTRMTFD